MAKGNKKSGKGKGRKPPSTKARGKTMAPPSNTSMPAVKISPGVPEVVLRQPVTVQTVPLSGDPTSQSVPVPRAGLTVLALGEAAKLAVEKKDITVNGQPATLETVVTPGSMVVINERPQGS